MLVFESESCRGMIKLFLVQGHYIIIFALVLLVAINTVSGNLGMKALVFFESCHKFLMTRLAGRIRDSLP